MTTTADEGSKFQLVCLTNINKNVEHQISWTKDNSESPLVDKRLYARATLVDSPYANSQLEFKSFAKPAAAANYSGAYRCKVYIRYPDVGQGQYFASDAKQVDFVYSTRNISPKVEKNEKYSH